ncbi:MAG: alpha-hydroxy-acid oxidizing protein [Anaerolineae bacterium]|nr:alpha-hydroxy-acid oxidizing protein [Anaerolineae bacterium]
MKIQRGTGSAYGEDPLELVREQLLLAGERYFTAEEHDACAIVASIRTSGEATHGNLKRTIEALGQMGHRSGDVQSEGDGCGVLTDIPRQLWMVALEEVGRPAWLAEDKRFFVGHLMIPAMQPARIQQWQVQILKLVANSGADLLLERRGATRSQALGRLALAQEPFFWQIAGVMSRCALEDVERELFDLMLAIETQTPVHVASLSSHSVVFKVRGSVETLYHYYPELRSRGYTSAITIGHARYSTNTTTIFERVQPFTFLGHNGEINTISRLREQALMLGAQLVQGGSDSQDVNRVLELLIHRFGFSLIEAMELVFPPIVTEIDALPDDLRDIYRYYRGAFGHFAQGPAAIIARYGDTCIGSVDALGLRPLWYGETEKECFFSSEKGVVPMDLLNDDPKPLAPGEKIAVHLLRGKGVDVLTYPDIQREILTRARQRFGNIPLLPAPSIPHTSVSLSPYSPAPQPNVLAAFGWTHDDQSWLQDLAELGKDPIASLGFDGPLTALNDQAGNPVPHNLSDYFKEKVAVVTNPAVDREREQEHFSTLCIIGPRPSLIAEEEKLSVVSPYRVLDSPILVDGQAVAMSQISDGGGLTSEECALDREAGMMRAVGTTLEDVISAFSPEQVMTLSLVTEPGETVRDAVERLAQVALTSVQTGTALLVLDDTQAFTDGRGWVDPLLAIARVDKVLRIAHDLDICPYSCRRQVGLVVRSAAFRNLHDLILALGLGADAVAPYLLLDVAMNVGTQIPEGVSIECVRKERLRKTLHALRIGLEKITSTMGIHELRGYGRIFASIGLSTPLVEVLEVPNYGGSAERGLTWVDLDKDVEIRRQLLRADKATLPRIPRFYPLVGNFLRELAQGKLEGSVAFAAIREQEKKRPVTLRHVIGLNTPVLEAARGLTEADVDASITGHDLPFVIASMSFGSQSETAFRAYAEAAKRLNIVTLNGEGGEIEDMMGQYAHNRGQQIASGRFGVNINLLNASNFLEIKVGQGAKPGEGGHLPGRKVSAQVARARHVSPGIDLISPSNNHDIYSIEDLAQFIEELKTANPKARVIVKVPVVPGIGVIAVGIAKAGADVINLTGYDGGTGAARAHSIQYVGLPAEIGIVQAHRALLASNMRQRVEIWADGGVRSPDDVVKLLCLGANRVGFGTAAMLALGCLLCRQCKTGKCPMGITTQIKTVEEASARGFKRFTPLDYDVAVNQLVTLFQAFGEGVKVIAARLGVARLQDLVGRADLLEQTSHFLQLNLRDLLTPAAAVVQLTHPNGLVPLRRPRNHLTTVISNLVMEAVAGGEKVVAFEDDRVTPVDRALGTHLAGALTRYQQHWNWLPGHEGVGGQGESWRSPVKRNDHRQEILTVDVQDAYLGFYASTVPGNGLGAFGSNPLTIFVEGGAQDGVGKGLYGGRVVVLKGYNHNGVRIDGAVGKGLGYGAIAGTIVVQGNADSRACVRLSGADVIIAGEITTPLQDELGCIGARANVKGFLCEYMTAGRVLVLGDPGPWICAGMTGGILYIRLNLNMGLNMEALRRRIARGANVELCSVAAEDGANLRELIEVYADELVRNHQNSEAIYIRSMLKNWEQQFVKIIPCKMEETVAELATE